MQRLPAILMSVLYLALTLGFSVNTHYCGGKIDSVSIVLKADKCCCGDKVPMKGCCSNESIFLQLDEDQQSNDNLRIPAFNLALLSIIIPTNIQANSQIDESGFPSSPDPPPLPGRKLRIQYGSLLTFG